MSEAARTYGDVAGFLSVPGTTGAEWEDSDQCRDCFQPSFNYRPLSSVQYMMALSNFDTPTDPLRFRFGFLVQPWGVGYYFQEPRIGLFGQWSGRDFNAPSSLDEGKLQADLHVLISVRESRK